MERFDRQELIRIREIELWAGRAAPTQRISARGQAAAGSVFNMLDSGAVGESRFRRRFFSR